MPSPPTTLPTTTPLPCFITHPYLSDPCILHQGAQGVIKDWNIKWEDFCIATPRMIEAMGRANWPHEWIQIMVDFWTNLQIHPFCSSSVPFKQKSLLIYQAKQRRLCIWHIAITNPHSRYNLALINEALLRDTKEWLFWEDWVQLEVVCTAGSSGN